MSRLDVTQIDPISEQDLSIFLDCEIKDSSGDSIPLNDVSVVISVFDTTQNFIMQKLIAGSEFDYNWGSETALLLYLRNEILNIDDNPDLNPGRYQLRFSFILDTFESIENEDNRFIVTEISPDLTEIRLNPLSNATEFINTFTRIKNYERTTKKIKLSKSGFAEFYRSYVNSVFSTESVNNIFSDSEVIIDGQQFSEYLKSVYIERSNLTSISEREAEATEKAQAAIEEMKRLLISKKGDALIAISQYFESVQDGLFQSLRNTPVDDETKRTAILNDFKVGLKNEMELFLSSAIDEIIDLVLINDNVKRNNITQEDIDNLLDPVDDDPGGVEQPILIVDSSDDTDSTNGGGTGGTDGIIEGEDRNIAIR